IDGDSVQRNIAYYAIAHASKFVPQNSVRIESTANDSLSDVAFHTPKGKTVLIVANTHPYNQRFSIIYKGEIIRPVLEGHAVATFVW
ncbi:MAG: glycoside hydrolase family 30 beta sandwich domain-containing protein, partial [Chitinophagaceae bacterium]